MPELPEVEVICQGLLPHLIGKTIMSVRCSGKQLRLPLNCDALQSELANRQIISLTRRAKYLILKTDNGATLIIHLGMTGNMGIFAAESPIRKHDHVCWLLDDNRELRFNDTRRFGMVRLFHAKNAVQETKLFFSHVGPEPFSRTCSVAYLKQRAASRKQAVKNFIMDSHVIAGIGNIYANEILFLSRIHPERRALSLSKTEWKRLLTVMRKTLTHAISCGGSTISDFVNASGEGGYFQMNFRIYGKAGEACSQCGQEICKITVGGRASFFCKKCQPKQDDSNK